MMGRLNINRIMPHEIRKECGGCGMSKPVSEFHNSSVNEDGKQNRCKVCQRVYREKRKGEVKIVEREKKTVDMVLYRREYHRTHREQMNRLKREWMERNKDRMRVKNATRYAIKVGKLVRAPCVVCGEDLVEAHHPDYSKPLEVVWLCHTHHLEVHGKVDPDAKKDVAISVVV